MLRKLVEPLVVPVKNALVVLVVAVVILGSFLQFRLTIRTARTLAELRSQYRVDQTNISLDHEMFIRRLEELETEVFGRLPLALEETQKSKVAPPSTAVQQWQRNRDLELRRRLQALEEWRMKLERERIR